MHPSSNALRQEIDAIDGDLHGLIRRRASLVGEITASKPPGGLALRPGREATVMRQRLAAHDGALPRRRRLPHVARDDERLLADADAGAQGRRLPAGRPAGLLGSRARPFRLPGAAASRYESPMQVLAEVRADPDDHRRRAGADRNRHRAVVAAARQRRADPAQRRGPPALPGDAQRPRARHLGAGAGPHRAGGERRGPRADLGRSAGEHQPQPHRRRPDQGRACRPSLRPWTRSWPACITICSSCRT